MAFSSKLPDVGTTIFTIMSRRAHELGALNLGQGFPDYDIDPRITQLVTAAMTAGHNQYAPMPGTLELRTQIARKIGSLLRTSGRPRNGSHYHARRHRSHLFCHSSKCWCWR